MPAPEYTKTTTDIVRTHYELYPYPDYPLLASIRRHDTYALNLSSLWARFNGQLPPRAAQRILIAGCGSFSPYPFALANPRTDITALDLSVQNINRARMHCFLHGHYKVDFQAGNLLDQPDAGSFGLIDAFGVLHHLQDPLTGLKALAAKLAEGGILRIMMYSRYARRSEESIRKAFRLLNIKDLAAARNIIGRAKPGSRLHNFIRESAEAKFDSGLADSLLHPRVQTFRINELMDLVYQCGLQPLLFAHNGAVDDIDQELDRLNMMEKHKESPGNFIVYLGLNTKGPCGSKESSTLMLNPCLSAAVGPLKPGTLHIAPRLGRQNPALNYKQRCFLRQFRKPVPVAALPAQAQTVVELYKKSLFLIQCRENLL